MFSIQQLIKALRRLESNSAAGRADLVKSLKQTIGLYGSQIGEDTTAATLMTSLTSSANIQSNGKHVTRELREQSTAEIEAAPAPASALCDDQTKQHIFNNLNSQNIFNYINNNNNNNSSNISDKSSQATNIYTTHQTNRVVTTTTTTTAATATATTATQNSCSHSHSQAFSNNSHLYENGPNIFDAAKETPKKFKENFIENIEENCSKNCHHPQASKTSRSQRIQNFYQQQLYHFHTHNSPTGNNKQKQTQLAVMASLATEQLSDQSLPDDEQQQCSDNCNKSNDVMAGTTSASSSTISTPAAASAVSCGDSHVSSKPCFNAGLTDILQFMELIGNLKHIKRTGWVLRDVNDCESISGHMYRMSILTFLLDGSEGLNQTRCMELALVHDLAESLVGDITPFCGVSKVDKRAMEFKAMEDICKLIEPRGKRIMELFEEYELGESAESQFVKDLDRLDMVMQAFEYEKRDNCLLKHQEFFDSTAGKFKHPFVKKLINEIYEQRNKLAKAKGAILPPKIDVPSMELKSHIDASSSNGHCSSADTTTTTTVSSSTTTTTS